MTNSYELEAVLKKLSQLEQSHKRIKLSACCLVLMLITVAITGANLSIPDIIGAREIQLRDAKGKMIASLDSDPVNGIPSLQFFDPRPGGVLQASYSMNVLSFLGKIRNGIGPRIELGIEKADEPALVFRDDEGKDRMICGISPNNQPFLLMKNAAENEKLLIRLDENENPVITLKDENEKDRATFSLREDGSPFLGFLKLNKNVSMSIDGGNNRNASITFIDQNGKSLIVIEVRPDGQSNIHTNSNEKK